MVEARRDCARVLQGRTTRAVSKDVTVRRRCVGSDEVVMDLHGAACGADGGADELEGATGRTVLRFDRTGWWRELSGKNRARGGAAVCGACAHADGGGGCALVGARVTEWRARADGAAAV